MIATLFHNPTAAELNARNAFIASLVCLLIAAGWAIGARVLQKKEQPRKLPSLWWCIAGSGVSLFVLAFIGEVLIQREQAETDRLEMERFRQRTAQKPNQAPEPTRGAVTPRAP